ncbi:sensor histidine kinase [Sediminitomix flava]|uniref:Histidine kinase n=1 Tax=Sediminitomix flava TaxID=379075 RepID=A0A315ZF28_SEDFL|nr:histidine kinase [Sediminitomix flava]PWJ43759.1 histidine kinase [Sediminitomix flava]
MNQFIKKTIASRMLFELSFWGSMLIIICLFLGHFHQDYFNTFVFCIVWLPFTIAFTYYLNVVLIQKYLIERRYWRFGLYLFYAIVVSSFVQIVIILIFFILLADLEYNKMNPIINDVSVLWFVQIFIATMYSSLNYVKENQKKKDQIHQLEKEKLEIELQLKELELNTLKDQIHPHFLFNTLNNIYGLAIEKSDELPHILLQLSGLLDYLVYQSKEGKVALSKEVEVLNQYIDLERLRFDDRLELDLNFGDEKLDIQIIPFLLFPMVENAFKHGIKSTSEQAFLKIKTDFSISTFSFLVVNSKPQEVKENTNKGTGLVNLRKRLALCYPERHSLEIRETEEMYQIELQIEL